MKLSIHQQAAAEIEQATRYYTRRDPDVGSRFLDELERVLDRLSAHPHSAQAVDGNVRRATLRDFPYQVFYRVTATSIDVLAVAHTSKRPGYWRAKAPVTRPGPVGPIAGLHHVEVTTDELRVDLVDGRTIIVPLSWFPRLREATQRSHWWLIGQGVGIPWNDVDEDRSVKGLLTSTSPPTRARR